MEGNRLLDFVRALHTAFGQKGFNVSIYVAPLVELSGVWYEIGVTDVETKHTNWYHVEVSTGSWFVAYKL